MVETLIVATIFSFVAAAIAMSFISGVKLWNKARNVDFARYSFLLEFENMAQELRQAINEPAINFEGSADEVAFGLLRRAEVSKVVYKFDPETKTLIRKEMSIKDVLEEKEQEEKSWKEKELSGWEDFSLSYFHELPGEQKAEGFEWKDKWENSQEAFPAIKIKVRFNNEEFIKVVFTSAS